MAEEEIVSVSVSATTAAAVEEAQPNPVISDHKRKLEDEVPLEEVNSNEALNEVVKPVSDSKRPRLEEEQTPTPEETLENGHEVENKLDAPPMENVQNPFVPVEESIDQENVKNPVVGENQEYETMQIPNGAENIEVTDAQNAIEENQNALEENQNATEENQKTEDAVGNPEIEHSAEQQQPAVLENHQPTEDAQPSLGGEITQQPTLEIPEPVDFSSVVQQSQAEGQTLSRKMEVPNTKVGVLIGKAGDTIRFLQYNSGAKIQITRDSEADPYSTTRPVELIGTLENVNKAEKLIKDVIAEADAGGSPSLVARGFGTAQAGGPSEHYQIQVPNEKVGLIIGKGGETIKSLQTKSGARIQLIPQHLPEGDQSKERIVKVTGDRRQIEIAKEMIKEVMSQTVRSSSGGQAHRHRGPIGASQWGSGASQSGTGAGYNYQQQGMYSSQQNTQYGSQNYSGYPQQSAPPRSGFNAGWDQRSSGPVQTQMQPQSGYYGQSGAEAPIAPVSTSNAFVPGAPTQANYNNYPLQGPEYGQQSGSYQQLAPPQHNYGQQGYDNQAQATQPSAYLVGTAQPGGAYPQQLAGAQPVNAQQPYARAPNAYAQGPPSHQVQISSNQSYAPQQQPYPTYGVAGGPTQQPYPPYGPSTPSGVANDGYVQPQQSHAAASGPVYPQQSVSGYAPPGGAPMYTQTGQSYGQQYPSTQQQMVYGGQQPVATNVAYGYQGGPVDAGYNSAPTAYGAPPSTAQAAYAQPTLNQSSYDQQQMIQAAGYGGVPANAHPGYVNSNQMYGGHQ
ncbi:hypothetical protein GIB67_029958 [Kingdonia uniflora]|uniref:K Homology domain-containing protein n=1 Tax=Kingdonia uniflora TaxID=39325 RepID=A0A7J7MY43_9MAGN|nr:hypothetical protein GIB67_029958 [Kingdonia uniflora]